MMNIDGSGAGRAHDSWKSLVGVPGKHRLPRALRDMPELQENEFVVRHPGHYPIRFSALFIAKLLFICVMSIETLHTEVEDTYF